MMQNILKTTKFQLFGFKSQTVLCFSIIMFNVLLSIVIMHLFINPSNQKADGNVGSIDAIALIWMFIIGLSYFRSSLKLMLSFGVSRRKFFWANILSFTALSAIWAVLATLIGVVGTRITRILMLYTLLYKDDSIVGCVVWIFAAMVFLSFLGWFITMLYYRSDKRGKWAISLAPFLIAGIFSLADAAVSGALSRAFVKTLMTVMGFSTDTPNPFIAAISMLILSALIGGVNFLLIRRAQIKA